VPSDWESLGAAIRERRRFMSMTLVELAAKVGLSQPFLSQVENGKAKPSLTSLHAIADALDTTPQAFFGGPIDVFAEPVVVRANDARLVSVSTTSSSTSVATPGFHVLLGGGAPFHVLEFDGLPQEFLEYYEHDGFESAYVVSGKVEIDIAGTTHVMKAGDSISYRARLPHRLRSLGARRVKVLLIETQVLSIQDHTDAQHSRAVAVPRKRPATRQ
jgi:quercetin dioxygenase-like cupin family protein